MNKPVSPARILIVEDDPQLREMLREEVAEAGHEPRVAADAEEATHALEAWRPELVICDLRLPGRSGLDLLRATRALPLPPGFLIITAFGGIPQAVEALKAGADNFLAKPLDFDHLIISIDRALEVRRLRSEVERIQTADREPPATDILGQSRAIDQLLYQIHQIGRVDAPVLITGESGVGKELVAHAIHQHGGNPDTPFVPVNCAGIPESLLESELFGHVAGAFTGAKSPRRGLFQEAAGGVLFLDEIGELPLPMQAKLLRVLQTGKIRPVGGDQEQPVKVRIVAATNRDLHLEVQERRFREDLYYRLETFVLRVPPLRERENDLELLAAHFLARYSAEFNKPLQGIDAEALAALKGHSFPGNVRELQNMIKHAVAFARGSGVTLEDLPLANRRGRQDSASPNTAPALADLLDPDARVLTLEEVKRRYIRHTLDQTGGNKRRAAALLGIGRHTLYKYLRE